MKAGPALPHPGKLAGCDCVILGTRRCPATCCPGHPSRCHLAEQSRLWASRAHTRQSAIAMNVDMKPYLYAQKIRPPAALTCLQNGSLPAFAATGIPAIQNPATVDRNGHGWRDGAGFQESRARCLALEMPDNTRLDHSAGRRANDRSHAQRATDCAVTGSFGCSRTSSGL